MVRIFGLEIPPGLDEAFFRIFQFSNNSAQDVLVSKTGVPTRAKKNSWNVRSLFVLWQDLYNGFDGARRSNWDVYWGTLPFGSHEGVDGWPGSGYSAFVYVNAPRYKAGLDLLLDPPIGIPLIYNGDFSAGGDWWTYNNISFHDDRAYFEPIGGIAELYNYDVTVSELTDGHTYRFRGFISAGSGTLIGFVDDAGGPIMGFDTGLPGGYGNFSYDLLANGSESDLRVNLYTEDGFDGYVDNIMFEDLGVL